LSNAGGSQIKIYTSGIVKLVLFVTFAKKNMSTFYKLAIKEVRRETKDAVSIQFQVPAELATHYSFTAGQYVTVKLTLDGQALRRAYSICSAPASGELRIAVKAVPHGLFSNFANTQLKAGDLVEVGVPEGFFQLPTNASKHKSYMGIAAGSGITPILSMIQSVLADEPQSTFALLYGNKTPEDTIFYSQLHELQAAHSERFSVQYVFSRTKSEQALFGRIDRSVLNYTMNQHAGKAIDHYFLCGPESMIQEISDELKAKNVAESAIKFELFSSTPAEKSESSNQGNTTISILVDGETTTFEMPQKQTVLEAALKKGIDAPYSCQGGICSSCLGRVTKGSAHMVKNTILSDSEVAEGLILTCQAHPTSSELFVDFDDV